MARGARETSPAQPLPGSEGAGTVTIDVAAKLLMVTPEWVRRLAKDGGIRRPNPKARHPQSILWRRSVTQTI